MLALQLGINDDAARAALATAGIGFTLLVGFFVFIIVVLSILSTAFWIWMLIDAARREFDDPNTKVLWIILLVLLGVVGAIVYYFVIKRKGPAVTPTPAPVPEMPPAAPPKKRRRKK